MDAHRRIRTCVTSVSSWRDTASLGARTAQTKMKHEVIGRLASGQCEESNLTHLYFPTVLDNRVSPVRAMNS